MQHTTPSLSLYTSQPPASIEISDLYILNPTCSSATCSLVLSRYTQHNYSSIFEHSLLSPFPSYIGTIHAAFQSSGTTPDSIHLLNILSNQSIMLMSLFFNISTTIPSIPTALPPLSHPLSLPSLPF